MCHPMTRFGGVTLKCSRLLNSHLFPSGKCTISTRPFPYINGGRSTFMSFFLWQGRREKKERVWGLQLKCDGHISLALLGPWQWLCMSWCDPWVFHFTMEAHEKNRPALLLKALQHRNLPRHRYGYSWDVVVTPLGKLSTSLLYFTCILMFLKQQQAGFYASRDENTCKNWNRALFFHLALQTTPLSVYRLSF